MCLLLAIIISCSTIAGCDWGNMSTTTPTSTTHPDTTEIDEIIFKMKWDYLQKNNITNVSHDEVFIEHLSGLYNDYLVAMIDASRDVYEKVTVTVGGVDFTYFDTNRLIAYKDGEFLTLDEAFEKGILSNADLVEIEAKFSAEKTNYYEICDKYDYIIELPYVRFLNSEDDYQSDRIQVLISYGGEIPQPDFFNLKDDTNELPTVIEIVDKTYESIAQQFYLLELVLDDTYSKNILFSFAHKLINISGVQIVGDYILISVVGSDNTASNLDVGQWGIDTINIERVWHFTDNLYNVNIGVVDTGIYPHIDIADILQESHSCDFVNDSENSFDDPMGHGTFVAGIIGAVNNNAISINGTANYVSIYSFQVIIASDGEEFNPQEYKVSDWGYVKEAINYASNITNTGGEPIHILNISMGGFSEGSYSLVDDISGYNGLIVFCAGNEHINLDDYPRYPQSYNLDNIIVVGALDRQGNIHATSNYGIDTVDIYAPGKDIYSTLPNNTYGTDSGTSFAAPYVSGVAALLLSIKNDLTPAQLKECIVNGGKGITIYPLNAEPHEAKKLDALGAMKYMFDHYFVDEYTLGTDDIVFTQNRDSWNEYFTDLNSMAKLNITETGDYTFNISATTPISIYFYDDDLNLISIAREYDDFQMNVGFSKHLKSGTYYLRIDYGEAMYQLNTATTSIEYDEHFHEYTEWVEYSPTQHIECCECGVKGTLKANHVVKSTDSSKCMLCGATIDLVGGFGESFIQNIQKATLNGSYILPNGIIVLVDEDVEAYFNGTLVFYDKNNLPQMQ